VIDAKEAIEVGERVRDAGSAGFGWLRMGAVAPRLADVCFKL